MPPLLPTFLVEVLMPLLLPLPPLMLPLLLLMLMLLLLLVLAPLLTPPFPGGPFIPAPVPDDGFGRGMFEAGRPEVDLLNIPVASGE